MTRFSTDVFGRADDQVGWLGHPVTVEPAERLSFPKGRRRRPYRYPAWRRRKPQATPKTAD